MGSREIEERAQRWIENDPDEASRDELKRLVAKTAAGDAAAAKDLAERFVGPLEFGTAGLRGVIGAGESRMNIAVVRRTTLGLADYLLADPTADVKRRGVVIGYDGRRMSKEFAGDAARVLAARGVPALVSQGVCPTPVTAYAVTKLGAAAGIMVTASHNPPEYNGYKVYWSNGAQIIPPHDVGIAAAIDKTPAAKDVPLADLTEARASGLVKDFPAEVEETYLSSVQSLTVAKPGTPAAGDRSAPIVYTPLHGVGNRLTRETLARAGFSAVSSVAEQAEPDGEFPTVAFPNPEEKGALDLSFALADKLGADLILANDPDVDRLAAAVRVNGRFQQLTGNQVGVLLGHYLLTEGPQADNRLVLVSCVSSPQLGAIAASMNVAYEETLTGFKWIANRAMELEASESKSFVFGYEEALGYTVGPLVRDKDGISAALLFAELWAARRSAGMTMLDELERIARKVGYFASDQLSVTMKGQDGLARIRGVMEKLRGSTLTEVGPLKVESTSDVKAGTKKTKDGASSKLTLPPSDVLIYALEGGSRIIARPSGTEPKIKIYFDVREPMKDGEPLADAAKRASTTVEALKKAFAQLAGL